MNTYSIEDLAKFQRNMSKEDMEKAMASTDVSNCSKLEHEFYAAMGVPDYVNDDEGNPVARRSPMTNKELVENGGEKVSEEITARVKAARFPEKLETSHFIRIKPGSLRSVWGNGRGRFFVGDVKSTVSGKMMTNVSIPVNPDAKVGEYVHVTFAADAGEEYPVFMQDRSIFKHSMKQKSAQVKAEMQTFSEKEVEEMCTDLSRDADEWQKILNKKAEIAKAARAKKDELYDIALDQLEKVQVSKDPNEVLKSVLAEMDLDFSFETAEA